MTGSSPLREYVHTRFREVFGEPTNTLDSDDQWSLKPTPRASAINILVNGKSDKPAIWIFDPHIPNDGVLREFINSKEDLEAMIKRIQQRVQQAADGQSKK